MKPYLHVKITKDSTNSAVQIDCALSGRRFHAHPSELNAPMYRAKVMKPYQTKMEPLIV